MKVTIKLTYEAEIDESIWHPTEDSVTQDIREGWLPNVFEDFDIDGKAPKRIDVRYHRACKPVYVVEPGFGQKTSEEKHIESIVARDEHKQGNPYTVNY